MKRGSTLARFVLLGAILASSLLVFLLVYVTQLHAEETNQLSQSAQSGAPVLSAPGVKPPSADLSRAVSEQKEERLYQTRKPWAKAASNTNREAGPFPSLGGSVGNVRFTLPDIIPAPTKDYPPMEPIIDIIERWNPDEADIIPNPFHETLQVFNYSDPAQRAMAEKYREAELPFKLYDVPQLNAITEKWTDAYLTKNLASGRVNYKIDKSANNHFMYWVRRPTSHLPNWKPPTSTARMNYKGWLKLAHEADLKGREVEKEHYYLQLGVPAGRTLNQRSMNFVSADFDFFSTKRENFFITNVQANKGIQCRFGMKNVIAEAHYDGGRNFVAMAKGAKRYILNPPSACKQLQIIPSRAHPSFRHSSVDWSSVRQAQTTENFASAPSIDTILHEGEILYIPSYWIHYIASLDYSIQCNSRSGSPPNGEGEKDIVECMGKNAIPSTSRKFRYD